VTAARRPGQDTQARTIRNSESGSESDEPWIIGSELPRQLFTAIASGSEFKLPRQSLSATVTAAGDGAARRGGRRPRAGHGDSDWPRASGLGPSDSGLGPGP
jgi:hypothetical protein